MADVENSDDGAIQKRIAELTSRLESEVFHVNASHCSDLESIAAECNKAMRELTEYFEEQLRLLNQNHTVHISMLKEEMAYLKELLESQHLMLQNNIAYIKELERRYVTKSSSQGV